MALGFTDGAYNRASGTRDAFGRLSDHLRSEGHPRMVSRDGDRELSEQIAFFVDRYRQQATGRGKYGDVRIWNGAKYGYPGGTRWVRVSPKGTVAVPADPPTSNHGKRRSNDLTYPYNNRKTAAHKRAVQLAPRYGITWEGANFNEDWHWTFWGQLGTIDNPAAAGGSTGEWDDMATKQEVADAVVEVLTGYGAGPGGRNHFDSLKFIAALAAGGTAEQVWATPIAAQDGEGHLARDAAGNPIQYQAQGYLASISSRVGGTVADIDEAALAQAIAPLLTANLNALSDEDVARIADAVADEQAKRLAS